MSDQGVSKQGESLIELCFNGDLVKGLQANRAKRDALKDLKAAYAESFQEWSDLDSAAGEGESIDQRVERLKLQGHLIGLEWAYQAIEKGE
jgi:hypothetical protein